MKPVLILFCISAILVSCVNTENNKNIIGNWQGASWLVNGSTSSMDAAATSFSFTDKGEYVYNYAGDKQKGTYKVENDMLFTKPGNAEEIMVRIVKLTKDSLVFNMNRAGQQEILTLLRKP